MEHTKYVTSFTGTPLVLFKSGWSLFSNFHICKVNIGGKHYNCNEQWYQSEKARFFNDHETFDAIIKAYKPSIQKQLSRKVKNFNEQEWNVVARDVMKVGLKAKIDQHPQIRTILKETEQAIIAEATEYDSYWGIGISISDPRIRDEQQWNGYNVLGQLWMELRNEAQNN